MSKNKDNNKRIERDLLRNKLLHSTWLRGVIAAAGVVVFCTVYALILPAAATTSGNDASDPSTMGAVDGYFPETTEPASEEVETPSEDGSQEGAPEQEGIPAEGIETAEAATETELVAPEAADPAPSVETAEPAAEAVEASAAEVPAAEAPSETATADGTQEADAEVQAPAEVPATDVSANTTEAPVGEIKSAIPEGEVVTVVSEVVSYTDLDEDTRAGFDNSAENTIGASLVAADSVSGNDVAPAAAAQTETAAKTVQAPVDTTDTSVSDNTAAADASVSGNTEAAQAVTDAPAEEAETVAADTEEIVEEAVKEIPAVYAHDLSSDVNGVTFALHAEDSAMLPETTKMFVEEVPADQYDLSSLGDLVYGRVFTVRFTAETEAEDGSLIVSDVIPADNVQMTVSTDAPALGELDTKVALDLDRNGAYALQESTDSEFTFTAGQISTVGLFVVDGEPEVEEIPVFAHELTEEISGMTVKVEAADAAMIPEKTQLVVEEVASDVYADVLSSLTNVKASHFLKFSIKNEITAEDGTVTTEAIIPASAVTVTVTVPDEIRDGYKKIALNPTDGSEYVLGESDANVFTFEVAALDTIGLVIKSELAEKLTAAVDGGEVVIEAGEDAGIPENAVLSAEEIAIGSTEYNTFRNDAASKGKVGFARFFRLGLKDADGADIIPAAPVTVSFDLGQNSNADAGFRAVLDMDNQARRLSKREAETFTYETTSFGTVGAVAYDFLKLLHEVENDYSVTMYYNRSSGVPDGATLSVRELDPKSDEYKEYRAMLVEALGAETAVKTERLFDITLLKDGKEIEPTGYVNVEINLVDKATVEGDEIKVVHFEETAASETAGTVSAESEEEVVKTPVEIKEVEATEKADQSVEVKFEADKFSVYGIVGTETIETTFLTADGETYKITVNYTKEAEIPNGSELVVREILRGTQEYEEYRAQTQEALGTSDVPIAAIEGDEVPVVEDIAASDGEDAGPDPITYQVAGIAQSELTFIRLFDISIMNGEEEVEPKVPVEVVITYVEPMPTGDGSSLDVVHFTDDGVEVLEEVTVSEDGTEIKYEAESFSVYGTARSTVGAGDYIIYRESNNYALSYTNGTLGRQSISIGNNTVTSTNDNVVFTFTAYGNGYRISYVGANGTTYYLRATGNNTVGTTDNANQASTWSYSSNRLSTTYGNSTRYLRYNNNTFSLGGNNDSGRTMYLAKIQEPATITIHYVNEAGEEIMASQTLPDSTSSGVTAIKDIVEVAAGYTYHNTYLTSTSGTQIVPELRGAGGGTWEYQIYGQETYTQFSGDTDIYVVYGNAYGSGSGSGSGGGGDDLEIDTPSAGKLVTPNTDGTFTLSLSITGEKDTGSDAHGANVILILDTSNSMDGSVSGGGTRFSNAVSAAQNVATNLMGLNTEDNPNLVEMCLVQFNKDVSTSGWYTTPGTANAQGTYPTGTFNRLIADASRNSGTNWEGALQAAITAANAHQDGDDTYIIFLTDGNPSTNATKTSRYDSEANTTTTSSHYYRISDNYMTATDEARQIVQNGWNFYSIGMYGNVDVLNYLTNFAYYGRSVNQTENKDTKGTYYYPAAETSTLIAALNDIADVISNSLAVAGVDFKDGIAQDVTHTTLSSNVGSGTLGGVTYRKNGGDSASYTVTTDSSGNATFNFSGTTVAGSVTTISYKKIVDVEDGDPQEQDATAQVYAATYDGKTYYMPIATVSSNGDFEWDVSPLGTLEDNATYTVSFVVWPDQDAYDYVTNLNNGIEGYTWNEATQEEVKTSSGSLAYYTNGVSQYPNIVKYPNGTYAAMSNTYQTVDYYVAQTEEKDGVTTTTYVKGDPIALDIPDPMVLTGSNFTVTKRWDDSLDQTQLAKLIAAAEAAGRTYSVTLNLNEDGEFYKSYTFEPVWNEATEAYEWPSQTINIAPALLTSTNPGGTYKTVTIDGTTYYVLNEGHEYVLEETNLDSHFEFVTETYHPALVNGVLKNVAFDINDNNEIVNGSAAEVVGTVPLTTFAGINTLKGGINIYKQVVDENESIVDDDSTFKVQVALDHISESGLQIWFDTYEVDPATGEIVTPTAEQLTHWINTTTGEITETEPTGYKDKVQIIDAEKGIYKNADGVLYGVNGKTPVYANETNYIGTGGYGNVSGYTNVLDIQDNWMIRIVNVLAGTTYEVTETQTNGMQPSYAYWHDNASSDEHIVIGNAASNIRITNKIVNRKIIVYKTDSGTTPLSGAKFTIDGNTLTSGEDGYTEAIELAVSGTPYDLVETLAPDGYIKLENPVSVSVGSSGVTYMQPEYDGGAPQTAERDVDGNYVIQVRNSNGVELPMTGGPGTLIYTLSGLALILASALMYGFRMRRRERRLN